MIIPDKNNFEFLLTFIESVKEKIGDKATSVELMDLSFHSFLNNTLTVFYRLQKLEELQSSKSLSESISFLENLLFREKEKPNYEIENKNDLVHPIKKEQGGKLAVNKIISQPDFKSYCWEIVHCKEHNKILELEQNWQTNTYWSKEGVDIPKHPQDGDIILFGAFSEMDKYSWIAPCRFCEILVNISDANIDDGNVWIGHHKDWEMLVNVPNSMNWLVQRVNLMPLWKNWKNYLNWVNFIPKALIIERSSLGLIDDKIYNFAKHLKIIDSRFDLSLSLSEAFRELPKNLHYIYAAMNGHILMPKKFSSTVKKTIIDIIANRVEINKEIWLQELRIQEDEPLGVERKGRFRSDVEEKTDENIPISSNDHLFEYLGFARSKENQILFWHKPSWIINPTDSSQSHKLPGGVVYSY